jgi:hypothetical protein
LILKAKKINLIKFNTRLRILRYKSLLAQNIQRGPENDDFFEDNIEMQCLVWYKNTSKFIHSNTKNCQIGCK